MRVICTRFYPSPPEFSHDSGCFSVQIVNSVVVEKSLIRAGKMTSHDREKLLGNEFVIFHKNAEQCSFKQEETPNKPTVVLATTKKLKLPKYFRKKIIHLFLNNTLNNFRVIF